MVRRVFLEGLRCLGKMSLFDGRVIGEELMDSSMMTDSSMMADSSVTTGSDDGISKDV